MSESAQEGLQLAAATTFVFGGKKPTEFSNDTKWEFSGGAKVKKKKTTVVKFWGFGLI